METDGERPNYTSYHAPRQLSAASPRSYHARRIDERMTQVAGGTSTTGDKLLALRWLAACAVAIAVSSHCALAKEVYSEDFNAPPGTEFSNWTSSNIVFESAASPPGKGEVKPVKIENCQSPNGAQRFLGEFGGEKIGSPADPGYNRTAVNQQIRFELADLPPHRGLRLAFDLYILKSWDGNSPQYGPDRLRLATRGGPTLFDTSFSNNHKVERQGSYQDHPIRQSLPQSAAHSTNTLGYEFFGDAIYRLEFEFLHDQGKLTLDFDSDLFEGKGTADESWGIDNMRIETLEYPP